MFFNVLNSYQVDVKYLIFWRDEKPCLSEVIFKDFNAPIPTYLAVSFLLCHKWPAWYWQFFHFFECIFCCRLEHPSKIFSECWRCDCWCCAWPSPNCVFWPLHSLLDTHNDNGHQAILPMNRIQTYSENDFFFRKPSNYFDGKKLLVIWEIVNH